MATLTVNSIITRIKEGLTMFSDKPAQEPVKEKTLAERLSEAKEYFKNLEAICIKKNDDYCKLSTAMDQKRSMLRDKNGVDEFTRDRLEADIVDLGRKQSEEKPAWKTSKELHVKVHRGLQELNRLEENFKILNRFKAEEARMRDEAARQLYAADNKAIQCRQFEKNIDDILTSMYQDVNQV